MSCAPPFAHSFGSPGAKIVLIGEAWGKSEEQFKKPFLGASGRELSRMLFQAGVVNIAPRAWMGELDMINWWQASGLFVTNVFALRPPDNKIEELCVGKKLVGNDYPFPPLRQGKYIRPEFLPEVERLKTELKLVGANLVVPLGATATWATCHATNIGAIRGTVRPAVILPPTKCLPTYHPAAILRNWTQRVVMVADLMKAAREAQFPEIRRPSRIVVYDPTLVEALDWIEGVLKDPPPYLACDIETASGLITHIGFAKARDSALSIPFVDFTKEANSYWPAKDEIIIREAIQRLLASPISKVFQNGLYDMQYLWRDGFTLAAVNEDTMLLHHALYPELQKGLGFMGSVYTDEASWKLMRHQETNKKDE